ncbi:hypothetical protein RD792_001725 [Penstemon davidsonii]|uniref:Uncharacterized protein n=1 Tax=Penstemon davidsonii TaxID=160366 RepID=A0ABR0DP49_9LAMI|nr:hypothetical protein RD792_001725 [Penstemon davidsonii]
MYYNGVYHLFYQYNPYSAEWGNISWAHSVSYNLIDWINLEHAIIPSEPYDIKGCWSGSATLLPEDNKPVILYTGDTLADHQVQNLAIPKNLSDPFLQEWVKSSHNPLMTPVGIDPTFYRDPTTAWQSSDKTWRVVIGSQIDGHGAAILYKSKDFIKWERADKLLHSSNKTGMWECPDFYPVSTNDQNGLDTSVNGEDIKHVLKASFKLSDYYIIGTYDSETDGFRVDFDFMDDIIQLRYDYGVFYASKSFYDGAKKRRILWGWVLEADNKSDDINRGWSGLQSIPRSISLDKKGKQLIQWPIEEVEELRSKEVSFNNKEINSGNVFEIAGITASQADVEVSFSLPNLKGVELIDERVHDPQLLCRQNNASVSGVYGPFGFLVLASENLTEQTAIFFRVFKGRDKFVVLMCSDQSRSSVATSVDQTIFGSFLDVDPNQIISLRTLVFRFGGILEEQQNEQPHRTGFHFQPLKNWMNECNGSSPSRPIHPNRILVLCYRSCFFSYIYIYCVGNVTGPMYYKGVYHLFYQYNPYSAEWGNISWAHSVSYNLIDWINLELAMIPSEPYDIKGCWSGSATIVDNKPFMLYTGINFAEEQVQNLATPKNLSDPFLQEWVKSPLNPLITPVDIDPNFYRDPSTAWQSVDKMWRILIGSQIDGHGAAILYKSNDFIKWERADKLFLSSNKSVILECPDFYPVSTNDRNGLDTSVNGDDIKHVFKASNFSDADYYIIGTYDSKTDGFIGDSELMDDIIQLRHDYGVFYGSKSFYDGAKKRRILWGWVLEADNKSNDIIRGWSGLQSIPRTVLLDKNGKQLIHWPIEEVEQLRGEKVSLKNKEIKSGSVFEIEGITASQADVEVSFNLQNLEGAELIDERVHDPQLLCRQSNASVSGVYGPFGLLVLASEDLTEQTAIFFRVFKGRDNYVVLMCSDQSRSSVTTSVKEAIFGSFLDVDPNQIISLRTLIDHSIIESFGGKGKSCITTRVYPKMATGKDAHIYVFNNGTRSVTISSLSAWSMRNAQIAEIIKEESPQNVQTVSLI